LINIEWFVSLMTMTYYKLLILLTPVPTHNQLLMNLLLFISLVVRLVLKLALLLFLINMKVSLLLLPYHILVLTILNLVYAQLIVSKICLDNFLSFNLLIFYKLRELLLFLIKLV